MNKGVWENGLVKLWSNSSQFIILVWDPCSGWIVGSKFSTSLEPLDSGDDDSTVEVEEKEVDEIGTVNISTFLLRTFTTFGFLDLEFVNFSPKLFDSVSKRYRELHQELSDEVPELQGTLTSFIYSINQQETPLDEDMEKLLEKEECSNPGLSKLDLLVMKTRFQETQEDSPFQNMFGREVGLRKGRERRALKSALLVCRHCHLSFTSKVSFRIHQRTHLAEAKERGELEGELKNQYIYHKGEEANEEEGGGRRKTLKAMRREERLERIAVAMEDKKMADTQDDAAKEKLADRIQNILHLTNEERSKRGRYTNISQETRDEIAEYALQYGEQEAVEHFSRTLNHTISLNAVRNYCKVYQLYSSELRRQIGEYADVNGLELASKQFSQLLGRDVKKSTVKRFRRMYGRSGREGGGRMEGRVYSSALRQEIGEYAVAHGVDAAVSVYSEKLQMSVKPGTVKKFKRLYMNKPTVHSDTTTTIDLLHSSINVLNQGGEGYTVQYSVVQPYNIVHHNLSADLSSIHGELVSIPTDIIQTVNVCSDIQEESEDLSFKSVKPSAEKSSSHSQTQKQDESNENTKTDKAVRKKKYTRGSYVQYSAEMRAKIGKFAAKHGNVAAIRHFSEELGQTISESTIRGMKDKYIVMSRIKGENITEVGAGARGRPSSFGQYDQILLNTLKRLEERGEKINSFAVIATAKQILRDNGDENSSAVSAPKLTPKWAKSVLKRLHAKPKLK